MEGSVGILSRTFYCIIISKVGQYGHLGLQQQGCLSRLLLSWIHNGSQTLIVFFQWSNLFLAVLPQITSDFCCILWQWFWGAVILLVIFILGNFLGGQQLHFIVAVRFLWNFVLNPLRCNMDALKGVTSLWLKFFFHITCNKFSSSLANGILIVDSGFCELSSAMVG